VIIGMRVEPGGARSAAGIREVAPSAHVVMLTTHEDERDSVRAVKAGATGFLGREHAEDAPQLIRAVSAGIVALPPLVAQALLAEFDTLTVNAGAVDPRLPSPAITARVRAVLKLAVARPTPSRPGARHGDHGAQPRRNAIRSSTGSPPRRLAPSASACSRCLGPA
jgi:DNA-binding NarL/FixJ family response regulator